jgi:glycosyltransferase involved in cell wall biosynthesis
MSRSNMPKISVCIPTFNGADYLRQAVESVLEQNNQNYEIVIVDNSSVDQTVRIVEDLKKEGDGRIRFYQNHQNIGLAGNLNKCLEYAQGEYIKYLCVDDVLLPECLEKMSVALDTHQSVTLVCGGRIYISETNKKLGSKRYASQSIIVPGNKAISRCLYGKCYMGEPSAVMFRKKDLTGFFREDLPQLMDMEMWFRLLEQGELLSIERPLCSIRLHSEQMTYKNIRSGKLLDDNVKLFDSYSQKPYLETTPLLVIQHKFLMAYRVWISRKFISDKKKKLVLRKYASKLAYLLMPLVWCVIGLKKWTIRKIIYFQKI